MAQASRVRIGVAGVGGYAREISNLILREGPGLDPAATLVAACDPALQAHPERVEALKEAGVALYDSYEAMLAEAPIDAVWLPVPIPLHRPFTEQALAAGKPVMVEKPVAGSMEDVDAMIAASDAAGLPVAVGFQDVYDATTVPLKRRIREGVIGQVKQVTLSACWPRAEEYFNRASWVGRRRLGETWVLDSPANNALAHFVNIVLFLLGPTDEEAAVPVSVEAETYRAARIENFDTVSARARLSNGSDFVILLTHAGVEEFGPRIEFVGDKGRIQWTTPSIVIQPAQVGAPEEVIERDHKMRRDMLARFARLVRGQADTRTPVATLWASRAHSLLIHGIAAASEVQEVDEAYVDELNVERRGKVRAIKGIEAAIRHAAAAGRTLHEDGQLPFTRPGGRWEYTSDADLRGSANAVDEQSVAKG